MSPTKIESTFWLFALLVYGIATFFPRQFFGFLGRGRVNLSRGAILFVRITGGFCFFGTIYRLLMLSHG
jgi:hypothetical protein